MIDSAALFEIRLSPLRRYVITILRSPVTKNINTVLRWICTYVCVRRVVLNYRNVKLPRKHEICGKCGGVNGNRCCNETVKHFGPQIAGNLVAMKYSLVRGRVVRVSLARLQMRVTFFIN